MAVTKPGRASQHKGTYKMNKMMRELPVAGKLGTPKKLGKPKLKKIKRGGSGKPKIIKNKRNY